MVAIITGRVPRYTESLHRAHTVARAPSISYLPTPPPQDFGAHWGRQAVPCNAGQDGRRERKARAALQCPRASTSECDSRRCNAQRHGPG